MPALWYHFKEMKKSVKLFFQFDNKLFPKIPSPIAYISSHIHYTENDDDLLEPSVWTIYLNLSHSKQCDLDFYVCSEEFENAEEFLERWEELSNMEI